MSCPWKSYTSKRRVPPSTNTCEKHRGCSKYLMSLPVHPLPPRPGSRRTTHRHHHLPHRCRRLLHLASHLFRHRLFCHRPLCYHYCEVHSSTPRSLLSQKHYRLTLQHSKARAHGWRGTETPRARVTHPAPPPPSAFASLLRRQQSLKRDSEDERPCTGTRIHPCGCASVAAPRTTCAQAAGVRSRRRRAPLSWRRGRVEASQRRKH